MAKKTSRFVIGLFVVVGISLGVVSVVWLGASRYFEKGTRYLTYFDESVQGLQPDSRVKYRGVDVGKVEKIGVASDQKLVEVLVKIDLEGDLQRDIVTQLRAAGITGIVFVELDRRQPDDKLLMPPNGIKTDFPVIASQPSQTKQMLTSVDRIMERIEKVDLEGMSDQAKATTKAVENFFSGRAMTRVMGNLDSTTGYLSTTLMKIDALLAEGKVEGVVGEVKGGLAETRRGIDETRQGIAETRQVIAETRQGVVETRRLVAEVGKEMKSLQAGPTVERLHRLLEGLDGRSKALSANSELTMEGINEAVDKLKLLIERLRENPSDLIFSRSRNIEQDGGR